MSETSQQDQTVSPWTSYNASLAHRDDNNSNHIKQYVFL